MMTVHEVSKLTGVSVRTLHYYDEIGLLPPTELTAAGYRLYGEEDCSRLQQIMLFRELEFPLKEIRSILASPAYDREQALRQQIELLELKKERIENLIAFAKEIRKKGGHNMDFKAFDNKKLEQYAEQAKKTWGETEAYKEYEAKSLDSDQQKVYGAEMMELFREFGGKIISIGSDAHKVRDLGANIAEGTELAKAAGFNEICYFKKRQPVFIKIS